MITPALCVRAYHGGDWRPLAAVHDDARRLELRRAGLEGAFRTLAQSWDEERLFDGKVAVAEDAEGAVLGFAAWQHDAVNWLYVHSKAQRKGVARALMRHVLARADFGISIDVLHGNEPALALYHDLGFRVVKRLRGPLDDRRHLPARALRLKRPS